MFTDGRAANGTIRVRRTVDRAPSARRQARRGRRAGVSACCRHPGDGCGRLATAVMGRAFPVDLDHTWFSPWAPSPGTDSRPLGAGTGAGQQRRRRERQMRKPDPSPQGTPRSEHDDERDDELARAAADLEMLTEAYEASSRTLQSTEATVDALLDDLDGKRAGDRSPTPDPGHQSGDGRPPGVIARRSGGVRPRSFPRRSGSAPRPRPPR